MNLIQLNALLASLKNENDPSNAKLIAFYERKKKELISTIETKVNASLNAMGL